jgi:hypothetical protein
MGSASGLKLGFMADSDLHPLRFLHALCLASVFSGLSD